jgi:hypothetical protein
MERRSWEACSPSAGQEIPCPFMEIEITLPRRIQSSGIKRNEIWWKYIDVSEERNTSIFRVEE